MYVFTIYLLLFRAEPAACGSSQARGQIRATTASLHHRPAHRNAGSLIHWARSGIGPMSSWILVGFISAAPQQELPTVDFKILWFYYSLKHSIVALAEMRWQSWWTQNWSNGQEIEDIPYLDDNLWGCCVTSRDWELIILLAKGALVVNISERCAGWLVVLFACIVDAPQIRTA